MLWWWIISVCDNLSLLYQTMDASYLHVSRRWIWGNRGVFMTKRFRPVTSWAQPTFIQATSDSHAKFPLSLYIFVDEKKKVRYSMVDDAWSLSFFLPVRIGDVLHQNEFFCWMAIQKRMQLFNLWLMSGHNHVDKVPNSIEWFIVKIIKTVYYLLLTYFG